MCQPMNYGARDTCPWSGASSGERRVTTGQLSLSVETEEDVGG